MEGQGLGGRPNREQISLVQYSRSVLSEALELHGLQYTKLPCPSPTPELAQTHVH